MRMKRFTGLAIAVPLLVLLGVGCWFCLPLAVFNIRKRGLGRHMRPYPHRRGCAAGKPERSKMDTHRHL